MAATVTRQQFIAAVALLNDMNTLYQSLPAEADYPDWIEFYSADYVVQGDPLYVQTQLALGYTSAEMQFLFDLALHPVAFPALAVRGRKGFVILDRAGTEIESRQV